MSEQPTLSKKVAGEEATLSKKEASGAAGPSRLGKFWTGLKNFATNDSVLSIVLSIGAVAGAYYGTNALYARNSPKRAAAPQPVAATAPFKIYLPELRNIPEARDAALSWSNQGQNTTVPDSSVVIGRKNGPAVITTGAVNVPGCDIPKGTSLRINTIGVHGSVQTWNVVSVLANLPDGVCKEQKLRLVILPLDKIKTDTSAPIAKAQPMRNDNVRVSYNINMKGPKLA